MTELLITGASGQLGGYLLREATGRQLVTAGWSCRRQLRLTGIDVEPVDLADPQRLSAAFRALQPQAVIHAAAISSIQECHQDPQRAKLVNTVGTQRLLQLAAEAQTRVVFVSTDLVFDGTSGNYDEQTPPAPLSVYARTKVAAERLALQYGRALVARVSLLFGPSLVGRPSFFDQQLAALRQNQTLRLFVDEWRTPLSLQTAAAALIDLAMVDVAGTLHVGGPERMSRWEMGQRLAETLGADKGLLQPARQADMQFAEPRPQDVSLNSSRWRQLMPESPWPDWEEAAEQLQLCKP